VGVKIQDNELLFSFVKDQYVVALAP